MFLLSRQWLWLMHKVTSPVVNAATFKTSAVNADTRYYEALGISPNSTQNDIKTAYYNLSKLYHPDKNKGSESAAIKFREITQAYEVLGNYRLRRLYDKGVIHTAGSQYAHHSDFADNAEPEVEDDPETKFYKSRFKKSKVSDAQGRTPIYDFDEWSRIHYGKSFERRKTAKGKFDRQETQKAAAVKSLQSELVIFLMITVLGAMYLVYQTESALDTPRPYRPNASDGNGKQ